ncbi:MAG: DUF86 domain-containing protein [Bacteroidales bacterium]|jgi:uncharacterized protein with HEPN domain|nr:DUF86 domain-containing protein [Bacteroidales bacterium]
MYDKNLIVDLLCNIEDSLALIIGQTAHIRSANDFISTPEGIFTLNGVCMNLFVTGEAVKNINRHTGKELLSKYPSVPWQDIMRMRDKIAHHYFDIDAEKVFDILRNDVPPLLAVIKQIKEDLCRTN